MEGRSEVGGGGGRWWDVAAQKDGLQLKVLSLKIDALSELDCVILPSAPLIPFPNLHLIHLETPPPSTVALVGILPTSQGLWKQALGQQVLHVPLRRALTLPGPEDPPAVLLIRIQLRLDKLCNVSLIGRTQAPDRPNILPRTRTHVATPAVACKGAIVPRTFTVAVEPFGAIGQSAGPFAYDCPLVCAGYFRALRASGGDVGREVHGDLGGGEDLIVVGVEDYVVEARFVPHEAVPVGLDVLECVLDADGDIVA